MRLYLLTAVSLVACVVVACSPDEEIPAEIISEYHSVLDECSQRARADAARFVLSELESLKNNGKEFSHAVTATLPQTHHVSIDLPRSILSVRSDGHNYFSSVTSSEYSYTETFPTLAEISMHEGKAGVLGVSSEFGNIARYTAIGSAYYAGDLPDGKLLTSECYLPGGSWVRSHFQILSGSYRGRVLPTIDNNKRLFCKPNDCGSFGRYSRSKRHVEDLLGSTRLIVTSGFFLSEDFKKQVRSSEAQASDSTSSTP